LNSAAIGAMYVRRTQTRSTATGETYFTHRLVRSERYGNKVRAVTLLNLGRHFPVPQAHWPTFCARIEELVYGPGALLPMDCPPTVEQAAQRYAALLLARLGAMQAAPSAAAEISAPTDVQSVDVDSLELTRPRSVGVEQVALWAMQAVGFVELLVGLGVSGPVRAAIAGSIIARMAQPASERATRRWLEQRSGLGELLEGDFEGLAENALYRASDALMKHRSAIEDALFRQISDLFGLQTTVTLYDLTNSYFEGEAALNPKAQRGRSKEKRTDCPLVTLGLASEDNLVWLREQGYRYLVVSRERERQFDPAAAVGIESAQGELIQLQLVRDEAACEVRLYCYSKARAEKENAMERLSVQGGAGFVHRLPRILGFNPSTIPRQTCLSI